jgi:uncharacterized tellurite resistance protein B-like protein
MRQYVEDSGPAVARVLSLALMADGAIDASELDCLRRRQVLERFGLDEADFDRVMREFCEDLNLSLGYFDALQCRLHTELVDALLDEIKDPARRRALLDAMMAITCADGALGEGERLLLARAALRWEDENDWPVRIRPATDDA